jgi:hypothetical protein
MSWLSKTAHGDFCWPLRVPAAFDLRLDPPPTLSTDDRTKDAAHTIRLCVVIARGNNEWQNARDSTGVLRVGGAVPAALGIEPAKEVQDQFAKMLRLCHALRDVDIGDLQMTQRRVPHAGRVQDHQRRAVRQTVGGVDHAAPPPRHSRSGAAVAGLWDTACRRRVPPFQRIHEEEAQRRHLEANG